MNLLTLTLEVHDRKAEVVVVLCQARESGLTMLDCFLRRSPYRAVITSMVGYRDRCEPMGLLVLKIVSVYIKVAGQCRKDTTYLCVLTINLLRCGICWCITFNEAVEELIIPYVNVFLCLTVIVVRLIRASEKVQCSCYPVVVRIKDIVVVVRENLPTEYAFLQDAHESNVTDCIVRLDGEVPCVLHSLVSPSSLELIINVKAFLIRDTICEVKLNVVTCSS